MALVLDTGPLYASLDRGDAHHRSCLRLIESSIERLVIPAPVLVEVDYFLGTRLQPAVQLALLDDILDGRYWVEDVAAEDYHRIRELCRRDQDASIGFVDAAVLAIIERLREPKLATLDRRHFAMLQPRHVDALTLLPE